MPTRPLQPSEFLARQLNLELLGGNIAISEAAQAVER